MLGASGGDAYHYNNGHVYSGGLGGYSVGVLYLSNPTKLYLNIGAVGYSNYSLCVSCHTPSPFNGGGKGYIGSLGYPGASGGGATDIRLNGNGVDDRIIVAGAGGGAGAPNSNVTTGSYGGNAGGEIGETGGPYSSSDEYSGKGGSQIKGGEGGYHTDVLRGESGDKNLGGSGSVNGRAVSSSGGGGSGYYGGGGSQACGGGGGSGYVGGVISAYKIVARTYSGSEEFPNPLGGYERGHKGNGSIRITFLSNRILSCNKTLRNLHSLTIFFVFLIVS